MRPQIACTNCRLRKKKCNRAYPACSYCLKTHDRCTYRSGKNGFSHREAVKIETPPSSSVNDHSEATPWSEPFFLDADLFRTRGHFKASAQLAPDSRLREELADDSDQEQYFKRYLGTFWPWISIVPPRELFTTLSLPISTLNGEDLLLLACIRLHETELREQDPRTKLYVATKSSVATAEIQGHLSVKLLQAQILVLLYEFGHGIYPSAYLTLGRCINYLTVLALDEDAPDSRKGSTWLEAELHRRLWWAVFVMERAMAFAGLGSALVISEPERTRILPCQDEAWDKGCRPPHNQSDATLATPLERGLGNFRLLALASHLLGQAIRIKSELGGKPELHEDTISQLHRTIIALENVIEDEAQLPIMLVGGPRAILNSAKMLLFSESNSLKPDPEQTTPESPFTIAANLFVDRSRNFLDGRLSTAAQASPFLLPWGYRALDHFYRQYERSGRPEDRQAIELIQETFHHLEKRWRLASVYTGLICKRYMKSI